MLTTQEISKGDKMKKLFIALLVLGLIFAGITSSQADRTRTIPRKSKLVTSDTLVSASGATLYSLNGVANASQALFTIADTTDITQIDSTKVKVEGGEATQYDSITPMDFGEGLVFNEGLAVYVTGAFLTVIYD